MNTLDFNHARDRRSLKHRYAEAQAQIGPLAQAAYANEQLTRERLEVIEVIFKRSLLGKLRWFLTGR